MSEIRFKISGDSPTFIARLYDATQTSLLQTKLVDTSGTTISFGQLAPLTEYFLNASDKHGYVVGEFITTPAHFTPISLPTRTVKMNSFYSSANPYVCTSHGTITATAPLVAGDFVDVNLCAVMSNLSLDPEGGVWNTISICCKPNGGVYTSICELASTSSFNAVLDPITIGFGDSLAYTLTTLTNSSLSDGYSGLEINTLSNSIGFAPSIGNPSLTATCVCHPVTTTQPPTTTLPPPPPSGQMISFAPTTITNTPTKKEYASKIVVTPALGDGCNLTINFRNWAYSTSSEALAKPIFSHAYVSTNGTISNDACSHLLIGEVCPTGNGQFVDSSITINSTNINSKIFNLLAESHPANDINSHNTWSKSEIIGVTSTGLGTISVNETSNIIGAYVNLSTPSGLSGSLSTIE